MEEKELVSAKSVHDDLLEAFRMAAHTNDLENKIKSLEETVAKREEELKNKEEEAEAAKSKFPLGVTLLCWFLAMFQIWPGVIAYFCFRSHYRKNPTKKGLQAQAKALQEADDMKQKLEKLKQYLNNMKASFESSVTDYSAIENFIKYLQAGRADNLKEAINLYEEELHRGRVEKIQRATLETTKATLETTTAAAEYSALAAKHAERTARAAEESAVSLDEIQKLLRKGQKKYVFIEHLFR